jgi:hypothetical protein
MIQARLGFSSCNNTLVGFTDKDGDYIVKSYGQVLAVFSTEGEAFYSDEYEYASEETRLDYARKGFERLAKRETLKV